MKTESTALRLPSGARSPLQIGLAAVGGFAAGALLVGMMTFERRPTLGIDETARIPAVSRPAGPADREVAARGDRGRQRPDSTVQEGPMPWDLEAAAAAKGSTFATGPDE
jgi:hypothetical protein